MVGLAVEGHPEGAELTGVVGEGVLSSSGISSTNELESGVSADHPADAQRVEAVVTDAARRTERSVTARPCPETITKFSSSGNVAGSDGASLRVPVDPVRGRSLSLMADAPVLGSPTAIVTHDDGQFSVEFRWERAPDPLWLKSLAELMKRSGREAVTADAEGITLLFHPQDAEDALDDFDALLKDAERQYRQDLDQRDGAVRHVQDTLMTRYGAGPDLPVREL